MSALVDFPSAKVNVANLAHGPFPGEFSRTEAYNDLNKKINHENMKINNTAVVSGLALLWLQGYVMVEIMKYGKRDEGLGIGLLGGATMIVGTVCDLSLVQILRDKTRSVLFLLLFLLLRHVTGSLCL